MSLLLLVRNTLAYHCALADLSGVGIAAAQTCFEGSGDHLLQIRVRHEEGIEQAGRGGVRAVQLARGWGTVRLGVTGVRGDGVVVSFVGEARSGVEAREAVTAVEAFGPSEVTLISISAPG